MSHHRTIIRLSVVLVALALAWACGGGDDSPTAPPTPEPARPTTVTVSPATVELTALGMTVQLTAEVRDQNTRVMAGATVTWSSGDASVATVDASGLVTGVAEGVATVTASAGSAQATAEITVADLERAALIALYEATDGPNWVNSENWLTDALLEDWNGVDADISGRVVELDLLANNLSGPIPPELGNLTSLEGLQLSENDLTGPIPPELGNLTSMRNLDLAGNNLTGALPAELAGISTLRQLSLGNNSGLSGPLPARLTNLRLEVLVADGTDLCAPQDAVFQAWLQTVHKRRVAPCGSLGTSMAYLTQAVQSREYPVPLVSGEKALLRVFVTATQSTTAGIPPVRARFYLNGTEVHVTDIPGKTTSIPTEIVEGDLASSANAELPSEVVQPGLEMVIEIDPDGTLDPGLGVVKRIPETGRMTIEVREMPVFDLTVIPFLWSADPNRAVVETVEAMEADPEGHELLWDTRTLLPIGDLEVTAHETVLSSSNNAYTLLEETEAIRAIEGGSGHYMGTMTGEFVGIDGLAGGDGRSIFSKTDLGERSEYVIAHELGHITGLYHPPGCEAADPDYSFPYQNGHIGVWGYDFDAQRLVSPTVGDLMSYCGHGWWISDYHFTNALRYRLFDEGPPLVAATSLLLWGGMDAEGEPFINPAFVVDAPPALPNDAGEHRIAGRTASGSEIFDLNFAMPEVADGDGSSSFAFVLPVEPGWADNLASITLSGPGGSVALDSDTDLPMAILLDPSTGRVRGILRDMPQADAAAVLAPQAGPDSLDVLFSRGIPDAAAWSR